MMEAGGRQGMAREMDYFLSKLRLRLPPHPIARRSVPLVFVA